MGGTQPGGGGEQGHTFGDTAPGEIDHDDGCGVQHRRDERTVNLRVRARANRTREEEVGELCQNEKDSSKRVIDHWAPLAQDDADDPCH